jgi:hypothetical protein
MRYYVFSFLSVSFLMYYSIKVAPRVSWRLGIRHYLVTLAAALITAGDAYRALYSLTHPEYVMTHFYVPKGFAPNWLYFSLTFASMILGVIIWLEAAASAARKPRARKAFLWVWPFYVVAALIQYVIVVQSHESYNSVGHLFVLYTFGIAAIAFLGFLIYLHFRSPTSDDLFLSHKAA